MFDHVKDINNSELYQIKQAFGIPEFVKEANVTTAESVEDLRSQAFADSANRIFPIHDEANTWLSMAYFNKHAHEYSESDQGKIKTNLEKAAEFFEIDAPAYKEAAPVEAAVKIAYPYQGEIHNSVSVHSFDELTKLAEDLLANKHKYPWEMRRDVSKQILASAPKFEEGQFKTAMEVRLQKTAGHAVGELSSALHCLDQRRVAHLKQPKIQEKIAECQKHLTNSAVQGIVPPGILDKVASFVDTIDRLSGMHAKYGGKDVRPPEDDLFKTTVKDVDDFQSTFTKLANGKFITKEQAGSLKTAGILKRLTGEKVASIPQAISLLEKLNPREANLISRAV